MDITSIGVSVDSTSVKSASVDLDKFVAAGARAEKGLTDLAAANKKSADASEDFAKAVKQAQSAANETSAFSQETAKNLQREISLLQQKAEISSLSANEARVYTLAQKGASEAQLVSATAALKTLEVSKAQKDTASSAQQANKAITDQIGKLETQAATIGATARQTELYKLAMQGATKEQLASAGSALKQIETHQQLESVFKSAKVAALALGAAAVAAAVGGYAAVNNLAAQVAGYKGLSEQSGETAENIAKLSTVFAVSGRSAEDVNGLMIRLTKTFEKTDDESALAVRGLNAIGISLKEFKAAEPVAQLKLISDALDKFADGKGKTAALEAIVRGGSSYIGFFNDLNDAQNKNGRLTQEQIERADLYAKAQERAKSSLHEFLQVVAVESLPAITAFISTAKEMIEQMVGIDKNASQLKNNTAIQEFAQETVKWLGYIVTAADYVARAFQIVGMGIGARAAQLVALNNGELRQAINIGKEAAADAERILNKPTFSQMLDKNKPIVVKAEDYSNEGGLRAFKAPKPTIDTSGLVKPSRGGKGSPVQDERKAQLALDIEEIRKSYEVLKDVYSNGEKVLEATHAANLIAESDYYAQKKEFLTLNERAQIAGLEQELARLQMEKVSGKDRLENLKKIADVEFKLTKARQDGAANQTVLAIQTVAANKKIEDSYKSAQVAAQDYFDAIKRNNSRTIGGVGKGEAFRADQAALGQIEEKFRSEEARLIAKRESDIDFKPEFAKYLAIAKDTYKKEVAEYVTTRNMLLSAQGNWVNGATEALQNYADQSKNVAEMIKSVFTDSFNGLTDQLTNFVTKGKFDLKSLQDTILNGITKSIIQSQITGPLAAYIQGGIKGESGAGGAIGSILSGIFGGGVGGAGDASKLTGNAGLAASSTSATAAISSLAAAATAAAAALGSSGGGSGGSSSFLGSLFKSFFGGGGGGDGIGGGGEGSMLGGFFADGGDVRANTINRVNERGPELLNVSGKQYLMMGSRGGSVTSNEKSFGGGMTVHNTFTIGGNVDRRTQNQIAESAGRGVRMAQSRNG